MSDKNEKLFENLFDILVGLLAITAVVSIFKSDESKIVSKNGKRILSDRDQMEDISNKIQEAEQDNKHVLI